MYETSFGHVGEIYEHSQRLKALNETRNLTKIQEQIKTEVWYLVMKPLAESPNLAFLHLCYTLCHPTAELHQDHASALLQNPSRLPRDHAHFKLAALWYGLSKKGSENRQRVYCLAEAFCLLWSVQPDLFRSLEPHFSTCDEGFHPKKRVLLRALSDVAKARMAGGEMSIRDAVLA